MAPEASMFVTMYFVPAVIGIVVGWLSPAEMGRQKRFLAGLLAAAVALIAIYAFFKLRPHRIGERSASVKSAYSMSLNWEAHVKS
jgi:hypothetical protein